MAALTDLSDLVNRLSGGSTGNPETTFFHVQARVAGAAATAPVAGRMTSLWVYDKSFGPGAAPTTGAIPTNATTGAIPFTNPGGGRNKWLVQFGAAGLNVGTLILYDRLFHIGNLSGTSTGVQTIQGSPASPALTRYTDGIGNFVFYEIYTAVGTTTSTMTMTYIDQNDVSSTSTINIGTANFNSAQRAQLIPLASGDTGVKAVTQIQLSASTLTAGNFGIVIGHPIAYAPIGAAGMMGWRDFTTGLPGLPDLPSNSCLSLLWLASTTTAPEFFGALTMVEA